MTVSSLSSSVASTPPPTKAAAPAVPPHDGDSSNAAKVQAAPQAGTGAKVDTSA